MERITKFRAAMLLILFLAIVGFFGSKLYQMQIVDAADNSNADNFVIRTIVKAARGEILDRSGNTLVGNRASYNLVFVPYVINTAKGTNNYLKQLLDLTEELGASHIDHFPVTESRPFEYTLEEYSSTWQGYFQKYLANKEIDSDITAPLLIQELRDSYKIPEEWSDEDARAVLGIYYELALRSVAGLSSYAFMEDVSDEHLAAVLELNIPGLTVETSTVRVYATEYAAHILGHTGPMNAKQWEYYKEIDGYLMDAIVGQSGLEQVFEEQLHGVDGVREDIYDRQGNLVSTRWLQEPKAGNNVETSIDLELQRIGEDELARTIEGLRAKEEGADGKDARGGAVVAIDINTGEILACGSYPTYDLSTFNQDYETLKADEYLPMFNRALQATYPPGSTYKMSMVVAGIDSGTIGAYTEIMDKGVFTKYEGSDGPSCLAWSSRGTTHGATNSMKALQKSCNYYFYVLGDMIDLEAMDATAKGLGLGESTGVELYEETGYRANADTKAALYSGDTARWYPGDQVLAAIGQSDNRFTPLQLCVYVSTLANQGDRYKATFLQRVVSSDYRTLILENEPTLLSSMDISDDAYSAVLEGMKQVARSGGTASQTFGDYPIDVACKTGTAETGKSNASDNGAFVCFAPADDPQIAIAIYGEQAGHGADMAVVARSMLDYYLNIGEASDVTSFENTVS